MINHGTPRFNTFLFSIINPLFSHVMLWAFYDIRCFLNSPTKLHLHRFRQVFRACERFSKNKLIFALTDSIATHRRLCTFQGYSSHRVHVTCTNGTVGVSTVSLFPSFLRAPTFVVQPNN